MTPADLDSGVVVWSAPFFFFWGGRLKRENLELVVQPRYIQMGFLFFILHLLGCCRRGIVNI